MRKLIVFLTFLLFFGSIASASFISLTTTVSEITIENKTQVSINITNSGDEAAFSLQISLILPQEIESDKIFIERLDQNASFEGIINLTRKKELIPGRYPVVVLIDYEDANNYPFSAISPSSLVYKTPTLSKVSGSISELTLTGKESKKLILNLKNLDDIAHEIKLKLFLPRELKTLEREKTLTLKEKEERKIEFEISNLAALEGSSYVVLASIEYEDNLHYSSFATGIIKIEKEKEFFSNEYLIFLLSLFVIIFICYETYRKISKKKKR
jgi:hypothetical protein